ncbi:hypothetical protein M422DRAFT_29075, partial [Sphaerobolus stellatus SS14]
IGYEADDLTMAWIWGRDLSLISGLELELSSFHPCAQRGHCAKDIPQVGDFVLRFKFTLAKPLSVHAWTYFHNVQPGRSTACAS